MKGKTSPRFQQRISFFNLLFFLAIANCILARPLRADSGLDTSSPIGFFTNLASRLLKSELNLNLSRLQIYPTNQYTPAVHRLLQLTANVYDATTNRYNDPYPHFPTVFRPQFTNDS